MAEFIAATDEQGQAYYQAAQQWYLCHGLRAAAAGGLFPDLFLRRFANDIEVSWLPTLPQFASKDFSFMLEPGSSCLAVAEVAEPLWQALTWFTTAAPPELDEADRESWQAICARIHRLAQLSVPEMEKVFLAAEVWEAVTKTGMWAANTTTTKAIARGTNKTINMAAGAATKAASALTESLRLPQVPAVRTFSPAVAMFGGVNPALGSQDVSSLLAVLAAQCGGADEEILTRLVATDENAPLAIPYQEGNAFADEPASRTC